MQPQSRLKMSGRDKARMKFVQDYREKLKIKQSVKNRIIEQQERFKDIDEGVSIYT